MTDFNQDDLRLMKKWKDSGRGTTFNTSELRAIARIIVALPDPAPQTMADTEWDHDTHYLAEAEFAGSLRRIMIAPFGADLILTLSTEDGTAQRNIPDNLTPTGRKFKLVPEDEVSTALPEGMRLADHKKYGRVVVSPKADVDGDYRVFYYDPYDSYGDDWVYVNEKYLTFLDGGTK